MRKVSQFAFPALLPFTAALAFSVVSCGPSAYMLDVEMRQPSATGVDIVGKTVSVAYVDNGVGTDSLFAAGMSSAFAAEIEKTYFGGDSLITLYCIEQQPGIDYSDKKSMTDLLVDTGSDVLFLFDAPVFGEGEIDKTSEGVPEHRTAAGKIPFSVQLNVYDSMDKRDTVLRFTGSSVAEVSADVGDTVSDDGTLFILKSGLGAVAERVGTASGEKFAPRWKQEQIIFFLFGSQAWYDTYFYVNQYEWQKALDSWMSMLDTENYEKKACIEYNIAAACYILGRYDLASEWLELSGTHFDLSPYTGYLKEKIEKKAGQ